MDLELARKIASTATGVAEDLANAAGQNAVGVLLNEVGLFLDALDANDPAESERQSLLRMQRIISDELARREANG